MGAATEAATVAGGPRGWHLSGADGPSSTRIAMTGIEASRMHAGDLVVLRKYSDELSARLAAMSLEANGIPAQVSADTAGGALPNLALGFPVRLIVRAGDAALARHLLDTEAPAPPDDSPLPDA